MREGVLKSRFQRGGVIGHQVLDDLKVSVGSQSRGGDHRKGEEVQPLSAGEGDFLWLAGGLRGIQYVACQFSPWWCFRTKRTQLFRK